MLDSQNISAEMLKHGGELLYKELIKVFWMREEDQNTNMHNTKKGNRMMCRKILRKN